MSLSQVEKATLNFYYWEVRGRGYYHFDTTVQLEPPYTPFSHLKPSENTTIDEGRVPSLLQQFNKLISPPKSQEEFVLNETITPVESDKFVNLVCFEITFPTGTEIVVSQMEELLNILSYSEQSFSFEILSQEGKISIQLTASEYDSERLESHLKAFFPTLILREKNANAINFDFDTPVAIADFGLDNEFMLPIERSDSLTIDPLTSIIATLGTLDDSETAIFQILFKGVTAPWSKSMLNAVSDGRRDSFFEGYPEFVSEAQEKVSSPLFGVIIRIGAQGKNQENSSLIASNLAKSITSISTSRCNRLIPLSNEGYKYNDHLRNIYHRTTNRLGCILNTKELAHFVHYPNKTVVHERLGVGNNKTKRQSSSNQNGIYLGENRHYGNSYPVYLETEDRLSHTHIIGATGVGKSTLIAQMILEDISTGRGCALFDPHGDICDDILKRIPEKRINDIVIIDPSDSKFPIGFNLLEAHTEAEKIVLSSDLVSAFKKHATAWGDNMTAVLQNAINTILDSTRGGTLIELKRFLIEDSFRHEYLQSVEDPSLHYYWEHEYPMVRKRIAPLLTRIDTFLRPKLVRYMLAQKSGIFINECLENNKVVLLKLSQGLIGEQNSYLLGSLFLAKFNQAALARQSQDRGKRIPYMLFLDEFQNFITPSIERILSGARKYGLGLTIVHQELGQIQEPSLLNSVLSNPKTRICFRLGDMDSKKLESGFSYFEQSDLQNLERGEAIMRIGSSRNDFNIETLPLESIEKDYSQEIIENTRSQYGTPREKVEALLLTLLPKHNNFQKKRSGENQELKRSETVIPKIAKEKIEVAEDKKETLPVNKSSGGNYIKQAKEEAVIRKHRSLQYFVRTLGTQRDLKTTLEKEAINGGKIDVVLENEKIKIAIEVGVTNTVGYEVGNIQKCIDSGYQNIIMLSEDSKHLENIKSKISNSKKSNIYFVQPNELANTIDSIIPSCEKKEKRVRGYRVKTNYNLDTNSDKQKSITNIIMQSLRKKRNKN